MDVGSWIICLLECSVWLEVREGGVTVCQGGSLRDWLPAEQNTEIILRDCSTSPLYCHIINAKLSFLPASSWEHLGWTPLPQGRNDWVIFQCSDVLWQGPLSMTDGGHYSLPVFWARGSGGLQPTITGTPIALKKVLSLKIYFYCRIASRVSRAARHSFSEWDQNKVRIPLVVFFSTFFHFPLFYTELYPTIWINIRMKIFQKN